MEIKNVLKTLVKLFFATPLLTVNIMSLALDSFDLAEKNTSTPIPTITDKNDSETKQPGYTLDLSDTEETKDSNYKLEISANTDPDSDDSKETQGADYQFQLPETNSTDTNDTEDKDQNVTFS